MVSPPSLVLAQTRPLGSHYVIDYVHHLRRHIINIERQFRLHFIYIDNMPLWLVSVILKVLYRHVCVLLVSMDEMAHLSRQHVTYNHDKLTCISIYLLVKGFHSESDTELGV